MQQTSALTVGSTTPTAGSKYHTALAREMADFIRGPLAAAGGIMTLAEVYCRYNRARTT